ncbi:MAG TPA: PEP-CTERM sorting domain-containing protein [Lacipirellulaceae bacterium]|nr:PEP-CTERM sorting domain-containing protein [Lacipirellulaceae bacterium]
MRKNLSGALAVFMLIASQASAQNLVVNPSFEDPTVSMGSANDVWFRFGSGAAGTSSESTVAPRTGARHIELALIGTNQFAGVFQNLNMTINPGQIINFTGWSKNASGAPFAATQEIKLEWQGTPNPPQNRVDVLTLGSTYEMFSHTGVAPAGTTGLVVTYAISSFGAGQGDSLVHLDDITVTIVPEPAAVSLVVLGSLGLVAFARRRRK